MAYRSMIKATISTHNGHTFSREHNRRNPKTIATQTHIYPEGTVKPNGRIAHSEIWHDETIKHAYHHLFDQAQADYNAKQRRSDRKINDYYTQVKNDKTQHVAYEMIIGVYNEELPDEQCKDILKTFVDEWNIRNPNLYMAGAYYHADEEGKNPHVHITYIPVSHGYTRGMETQAGLVKALGEQGYWTSSRKLTAQICWEAHENRILEAICNEHGIEVEHPKIEGIKHMETQQYKASERLKQTEREVNKADRVITAKTSQIQRLNEQAERAKARRKISKKHVVISKDAYYEQELIRMERDQLKDREEKVNRQSLQNRHDAEELGKYAEIVKTGKSIEAKQKQRDAEIDDRFQRLRQAEDNLDLIVQRMAEELADQMQTAKEKRMRDYMKGLKFKDGTTALDEFDKLERQRQRSRGIER